MSHFVVMVTNTDEEPVDSQLERFNEQGESYDYFMKKEYTVEKDWKAIKAFIDEKIKWWNELLKDEKVSPDQKIYFNKQIAQFKDVLNSKNTESALEMIRQEDGGEIDDRGVYYIYNPDAKWDWYSIGGRWDGWLVDKDGNHCNTCKVKDISFEKMKEAEKQEAEEYYDQEIKQAKEQDRKPFFWDFKETPTKEEYVKVRTKNSIFPFAILHEDEWLERGSMGWWGIVSNEKDNWEDEFKKWFKSLDPETEITIVDCHI